MPRLQHHSFRQEGTTFPIVMDGEQIDAIAGETIAAALANSGKLTLRRDKNGAPRGLFCGMGACFDCQVSVDGGPAQRACLGKVYPGMQIRSLAYRAELLPPDAGSPSHQKEKIVCDVMIVGAGPAGMSAAIGLADAGASVIIADERPEPGGQFYKQLASSYAFTRDGRPDSQYRDGAALIGRLTDTDARLISGASVWGAFRHKAGNIQVCVAAGGGRMYAVHAKQIILATGAFESVPAFPGWTLPGVMTTGAVQILVRAYRVAPGRRVLIAGNGPLNVHLACELVKGGVDVVALAESAPAPLPRRVPAAIGALLSSPGLIMRGVGYLRILRKFGVPLLYGHHILRADGDTSVRSGSIAGIGSNAQLLPGTEKCYEVDTICLGYALHPSNELARALGCRHEVVSPGVLSPVRDENGQTSIAGVFVIGDCGVVGGAHVAMAEGKLAARAVLRNLSSGETGSARRDRLLVHRHRRFQRHLWSLYRAADPAPALPDTPVCRCELVRLETIKSLIAGGVHDLGSLKRLSRAGMGPCQGRYCQKQLARILTDMTGVVPGPQEMLAPQLPVKPIRIANVAAEKPEWHGYRTVEMPVRRSVRPVGSSSTTDTNVLVIGAGIVGISTAMYLAREGVDVMIVDRDVPNAQASGGNAGSLHLQLLSFDFSDASGADDMPAADALSLQKDGIGAWQTLQRETGADIELEITGGVMVAANAGDLDFLRRKASLERRCGIEVDILSGSELRDTVPMVSDKMIGAAYCAGEGKINPMLATPMLLAEALASGAELREKSEVVDIEYRKSGYTVTTNAGSIVCKKIVNAAGGWTADIGSMIGVTIPVKAAPQQMIVTEPARPAIKHLLAFARRHLTMKQVANGNIIIGGGWSAGYESGTSRAVTIMESLEGNLWAAEQVVPAIGMMQMIRSWATVGVMIDGAPILGELPGHPGFFNAVAANGYTMGPILGQITAELARTGRPGADIRPFSVERFS